MKKILLTGQFTEEFRKVNNALLDRYEVRACVNKLEIFKGMFKLNKPDIVVLLIEELNKTNEELLHELKEEYGGIPVVCRWLNRENNEIPECYLTKQFEFLEAPHITTEQLGEKIEYALKKDLRKEVIKARHEKEVGEQVQKTEEIKEKEITLEHQKKTIMLVDDSGIYLRMMKGLLEEEYDIIMTTSGIKAIAMIHEKRPDLILLDYEMPFLDGRETMVKIQELEDCKEIPIVFVTAINDKEHIKAVLSLRPAGYLLKPIDKDRLFKTIKEIIGK